MTPDRALVHSVLHFNIPGFFTAKRHGVKPEHLYDEAQRVFRFIEDFVAKGRTPTFDEVKIATGVELDPSIDGSKLDPEVCAKAIATRTLGKQLSKGIDEILDTLKRDPFKARDDISSLVTSSTWSYGDFETLPSPQTVKSIRDLYLTAESYKGGLLGYGSPWPTMDKASRGLQRGELTVLFAKKKQGKTFAKLAWVEHIWSKDTLITPDDTILFLSMEMQPRLVYRRFAAVHLKLNYEQFASGTLSTFERDRFMQWCDDLINNRFQRPKLVVISSNEAPDVQSLSHIVARLRPKLVVIDSFYMLAREGDKTWERMLGNVQDLKLKIANAYDIPVLASTQLAGAVDREVLSADTDDAAYAKAIGDYADASRGLFGSFEHHRDNRRLWRGMESREFKPAHLLINFNLSTMDFSEIKEIGEDSDGSDGDADGGGPPIGDQPLGSVPVHAI